MKIDSIKQQVDATSSPARRAALDAVRGPPVHLAKRRVLRLPACGG